MEQFPIPGHEDSRNALRELMAMHGAPAFVRRALAVEAALTDLLDRCRRKREEWLAMVRLRLGTLHALLRGEWNALRPYLKRDESPDRLAGLFDELRPKLRVPVAATSSRRRVRQAIDELRESMGLFNSRWAGFLKTLDLSRVNELRDGYNRYFVLEKECAVRSARLAREGFVRLVPLTIEEVLAHLPFLPSI